MSMEQQQTFTPTVKYYEQLIQDLAVVVFDRLEEPEVTYIATIYFPCLDKKVQVEETFAEIKKVKQATSKSIDFFNKYPEPLCKAYIFKALFRNTEVMRLILEAELCGKI